MFQRVGGFWQRIALALIGLALVTSSVWAGLSQSEYKALVSRLDAGVRQGAERVVADGIRELAADDSKRAVKLLSKVFPHMPESTLLFDATFDFVAKVQSAQAWKELRRQVFQGRPWQLRVVLVDAIGKARGGFEIETFAKAATDANTRVAVAAIRQLGVLRSTEAVEALIGVLETFDTLDPEKRGIVWQDCHNALMRLLGVDLDAGMDYRNYYEARKAKFVNGVGIKGPKDARPAHREGASVTLFGQDIYCTRVVLIIDVSGSMVLADPYPPGEGPRAGTRARDQMDEEFGYMRDPKRKRINRAKTELLRVLEGLAKMGGKINVVAYSTDVAFWKPEGLHKLTAANLKEAKAFVSSFVADGVTSTDTALMYAFEQVPDADCFYLISDGFATHDGETKVPTAGILSMVAETNRLRKVQINTLGFAAKSGNPKDGADRELMEGLAEQTGGTYTEIR